MSPIEGQGWGMHATAHSEGNLASRVFQIAERIGFIKGGN